MSMMSYFRRPVLAGANLLLTQYATIRGSIRRNDVDSTHTLPYFSGLTTGQQIVIAADSGTSTTTLTGVAGDGTLSMDSVISQITAQLATNSVTVTVFNADGCLGLSTQTAGATGYVSVSAGSPDASAALGFDSTAYITKAYGAEVGSTPFNDVGNPFGTAFPSKTESFSQSAITRTMARMSANQDVLHADLLRSDSRLKKIITSVAATPAVSGSTNSGLLSFSTNSVASSIRIFTNGQSGAFLSRTSVAKDLSPYFQLIDSITRLPSQYKVLAVVTGSVTGDAPYSDAGSTFGSGPPGNILGINQTKVNAASITGITGGRVVDCSGANFTTAGVQVGDWATIASATNTDQGNNNGARWIVEQVQSATRLWLRPMSQSELALAGTSTGEVQPIIALSSNLDVGQSYGTLTISTGQYNSGTDINLVVSPPIPANASVDLWAACDLENGFRATNNYDTLSELQKLFESNLTDYSYSPSRNGSQTTPWATLTTGVLAVTEGRYRYNGRYVRLPAQTSIPYSFFTSLVSTESNGTYTLYLGIDAASASIQPYGPSLPSAILPPTNDPSTNTSPPLALPDEVQTFASLNVTVTGGAVTAYNSVTNLGRQFGEASGSITVGPGGQFLRLEDAINYLNLLAAASSESSLPNGSYPHADICLVGSVAVGSSAVVPTLAFPSIRIRGLNPECELIWSSTSSLNFGATGTVVIEDLRIVTTSSMAVPLFMANSATIRFLVRNVQLTQSSGYVSTIFSSNSSGGIDTLSIKDSSIAWSTSLVGGYGLSSSTYGASRVFLENSQFPISNLTGTPQFISPHSGQWFGIILSIRGCEIASATQTTYSLANFLGGQVFITASVLGGQSSSATSPLITGNSAKILMDGCMVNSTYKSVIATGTAATVRNSSITCTSGAAALTCLYALNNNISIVDAVAGTSWAISLAPEGAAVGNYIVGYGEGISGDLGGAILGNTIVLTNGTYAQANGIQVATGTRVADNYVAINAGGAQTGSVGILLYDDSGTGITTISGNTVSLASVTGSIALSLHPSPNCQLLVDGNLLSVSTTVAISTGSTLTNATITNNVINGGLSTSYISLTGGSATFSGNRVLGTSTHEMFSVDGNQVFLFSDNYFGGATSASPEVPPSGVGVFRGNTVVGAFSSTLTASAVNYEGNYFEGTFAISLAYNTVPVSFEGNRVVGNFTQSGTSGVFLAYDNVFQGTMQFPSSVGVVTKLNGNHIVGAVTQWGSGRLSSNYFGSTFTTLTATGVVLEASSNEFVGAVTVSASGTDVTAAVLFTSDKFQSTLTTYASIVTVQNSILAGACSLNEATTVLCQGNRTAASIGVAIAPGATTSDVNICGNYSTSTIIYICTAPSSGTHSMIARGNTLRGTSIGIGAQGSTVTPSVVISENTFNGTISVSTGSCFIYATYTAPTVISNNAIVDATAAGSTGIGVRYPASSSSTTPQGISITGNSITPSVADGSTVLSYGIVVAAGNYVTVTGNTVKSTYNALILATNGAVYYGTVVSNVFETLDAVTPGGGDNPSAPIMLGSSAGGVAYYIQVDRNFLKKNSSQSDPHYIQANNSSVAVVLGTNFCLGVTSTVPVDLSGATTTAGLGKPWFPPAQMSQSVPGSPGSNAYQGQITQ
jgi:hypothetical protein